MRLDPVHDLQAVFHEIMSAMATPGIVREIGELAERIDIDDPIPKPMLAIAMALLDAETVFCFRCDPDGERSASLSRMTSARRGPVEGADFVFVMGDGKDLAEAVVASREGTLVDPQLGATVVALVDSIEGEGELTLSGPGIESSAKLGVGLGRAWVEARAAKNREFPLGVDMLLVDPLGRLAALPRTTLAEAEG